MNSVGNKSKRYLPLLVLISCCIGLSGVSVGQEVLFENNFDDGRLPSAQGTYFSAVPGQGGILSVSSDNSLNYNGSLGSLRAQYPTAVGDGGYYFWTGYTMPRRDITELFIEFKAKMPGPNREGVKFLKVFSWNETGKGYANTTFQADENGSLRHISFADGTINENDVANVIFFDGAYPEWVGRSYGTAVMKTPQKAAFNWDTSWHHLRYYIKFNSGNSAATEVPDGEYYVEIDGKVYLHAKNVFNRHHSNLPIEKVELLGWAQNGRAPFEVWYDDVKISTGNFVTNPIMLGLEPKPPLNTKIVK
jgi:hypothetical protein